MFSSCLFSDPAEFEGVKYQYGPSRSKKDNWQLPISIRSSYCIFMLSLCMYSPGGGRIEACTTDESEALLQFRNEVYDPPMMTRYRGAVSRSTFKDWIQDSDCCEWKGVTCRNDTKSVIFLDLGGRLVDVLGPNAGDFQARDSPNISFPRNSLEGLCKLQNLQKLNLRYNGLSGSLPACLGNLTALSVLYLANNNLSGGLPSSMSLLSQLIALDLSYNRLDGDISLWFDFGSSRNLTSVDIPGFDDLRSNISAQKFSPFDTAWKKLKVLMLKYNQISGHLPSWLENLPDLISIDISVNQLSGQVPSFENSSQMEKVMLGSNNFEGMVSNTFTSKRSLRTLSLRNNKLTGPLPDLRNSQNLTVLDLTSNQLSGTIPSWLASFGDTLEVLMLGSNRLEGNFPAWLGWFQRLRVLDLSNNNIAGALPPKLSRLYGSKKVSWDTDRFMIWPFRSASYLPSNLRFGGAGWFLESLQFYKTFRGFDWTFFNKGAIMYTTVIDISRNALEGSIPSEFGDLDGLMYLNLSSNLFSGFIPSELGTMTSLYSLDVSYNKLTGSIPPELIYNGYMFVLNVSYNQLSGPIPEDYHFKLFKSSSYMGNPALCGAILEPCPIQEAPSPVESENEDGSKMTKNFETWIAIPGFLVGFVAGFVGSWTLLLTWKKARAFVFRHRDSGERQLQSEEMQEKKYGVYVFPI